MKAKISLFSALLFVACGGTDRAPGSRGGGGGGGGGDQQPQMQQGYTTCGSLTCQPGQHCDNFVCDTGCLSDANCLGNQRCDTANPDFAGISQCVNKEVEMPPPMMMSSALDDCKAACDHFQTCGMAAGDVARCRADCAGLTADQQTAVGNCKSVSCVRATSCLGVDCFNNSDCSTGQSCVGFTCL